MRIEVNINGLNESAEKLFRVAMKIEELNYTLGCIRKRLDSMDMGIDALVISLNEQGRIIENLSQTAGGMSRSLMDISDLYHQAEQRCGEPRTGAAETNSSVLFNSFNENRRAVSSETFTMYYEQLISPLLE